MSFKNSFIIIVLLTIVASGSYYVVKHRTVSKKLSVYVHQRYGHQMQQYEVQDTLVVNVFGQGKIGLLHDSYTNFRYWISSNSYDESYNVHKTHEDLLVGIAIQYVNGQYRVLLPRSANKLSDEQLLKYIDNIAQLSIRMKRESLVGLKTMS